MKLEYFVERHTLAKGFSVLGRLQGELIFPENLNQEEFSSEIPLCYFEELEPLREFFDVVLVKSDGLNFIVYGVVEPKKRGRFWDRLPLDLAEKVARSSYPYTGTVQNTKTPVFLQLIEIYNGGFSEKDLSHLTDYKARKSFGKEKFNINAIAIDPRGEIVKTNFNWLGQYTNTSFIKRILAEQGRTKEDILREIADAGIKPIPILVSVLVGVMVALGLRFLFAEMGIEDGTFYSVSDIVVGLICATAAIMARKIRVKSLIQGLIASSLFVVILFGILLWMGAEPGFWRINSLVIVGASAMVGRASENA